MLDLKLFVEKEMRMSAIYQPMVIIELLKSKTLSATMDDIGKKLSTKLSGNADMTSYYSKKLSIYPKQVLYKRGVALVGTTKETCKTFYATEAIKKLSKKERKEIVKICEKKVDKFIEEKGGK